jgi:hypothetical protein
MKTAVLLIGLIVSINAECDFNYDKLEKSVNDLWDTAYKWDHDTYIAELEKLIAESNTYRDSFDAKCYESEDGKEALKWFNRYVRKLWFYESFDDTQRKSKTNAKLKEFPESRLFQSQHFSIPITLNVS